MWYFKFKVNLKTHLLVIFCLFSICFLVYFPTLCPTVTWAHFAEFGPKILTQIYTEPLSFTQKHFFYLAVAKFYSSFIIRYAPFARSDPAFPINLFSALFSALTVTTTYLIIFSLSPVLKLPSHLTKPKNLAWLPAFFGSLVLAFSSTFWSQALVTQTASFNLFLFSLSLLFLLEISKKKRVKISLLVFFFLTLILLLNNIPSGSSLDFRAPREFLENWEIIISLILTNFSGIVLLLALLGLFFGFEKKLSLLPLLGICLGQMLLDSLVATSTTPPFFLPCFLVIALFSGLGLKVPLEIILAIAQSEMAVSFENRFCLLIFRLKKAGRFLRYAIFCLLGYFVLITTLVSFRKSYPSVNLKNEREAFNFGQNSLAVLPNNSLVFCETDKLFNTLEYFQKVVKPRGDLELLTFAKDTKKVVKANIQKRPVFFALAKPPIPTGETRGKWEKYTLVSKGPLYQVLP